MFNHGDCLGKPTFRNKPQCLIEDQGHSQKTILSQCPRNNYEWDNVHDYILFLGICADDYKPQKRQKKLSRQVLQFSCY